MDCEPSPGDRISVRTKKGSYSGIVMPRHAFSRDDILLIKLDSGYNIGISGDDIGGIEVMERAGERKHPSRKYLPEKGRRYP